MIDPPRWTAAELNHDLREAVELYLENAKELQLIDDVEESLNAKEKFTAHLEAVVP